MKKKHETHINIYNFRIIKLKKYYVALDATLFKFTSENKVDYELKKMFSALDSFLENEHWQDEYCQLYYDYQTKQNFKKIKDRDNNNENYDSFNFIKQEASNLFSNLFNHIDENDLIFECSTETINKIMNKNKMMQLNPHIL